MFYFSQPRNQTRKLKTSQPSEKTRYNSKIFYKICPIFDNKEENVGSRSVLLTVSQIILQSFSYFEPKILILSVTLLIPSVTLIMLIIALLILSIIVLILSVTLTILSVTLLILSVIVLILSVIVSILNITLVIILPFCFSEMARPPHSPMANAERHCTERHCTNTERRQQCTLICLMFYFSQPRNQTKPPKKKKRKAERTRYNLKLFYKICSIFDNKK